MLKSGSSGGRYLTLPWWSDTAQQEVIDVCNQILTHDWDMQQCLCGENGASDFPDSGSGQSEADYVPPHRPQANFQSQPRGYHARTDSEGIHNRACMWRFSDIPERPGMRDLVENIRNMFPMIHDTIDFAEAYRFTYLMDLEGQVHPHQDLGLVPPLKLIIPTSPDVDCVEFYDAEQKIIGTVKLTGPTLINVHRWHGVMNVKQNRHHIQYLGFYDNFDTISKALEESMPDRSWYVRLWHWIRESMS